MPADRAKITYRVAGTTRHTCPSRVVTSASRCPDCTTVDVSPHVGAPVTRTFLFAAADFIEIERGDHD